MLKKLIPFWVREKETAAFKDIVYLINGIDICMTMGGSIAAQNIFISSHFDSSSIASSLEVLSGGMPITIKAGGAVFIEDDHTFIA